LHVHRTEQRVRTVRALAHDHELAADRERVGATVGRAGGEERLILSALGDTGQSACGVTEPWLRPEIEAG
jgi:hypothetical protein